MPTVPAVSELAIPPPASLARKRSDWKELAAQSAHNPLLLLPAEFREDATRLWFCNAHLFPQSLAICATLRVYLDEHGLTPDDVGRVVDAMLQPGRRAKHRFAGDVLADLAALVDVFLRERRQAESRREESDRQARWEREAARGPLRLAEILTETTHGRDDHDHDHGTQTEPGRTPPESEAADS